MAPRPGLTPERIVDVAAELIDRDGYDQLGLGKVAAQLGVRTPSLYNHVAGLEELRRLLTIRALTLLRDRLHEAARGRRGEPALRAIATAHRRFAHDHPGLYATTVPSLERADEGVRRVGDEVLATVLAVLSDVGLDDREVVHAARSLRSAVHGFVTLELAGGFGMPVEVDASFAWLTDLLAAGVRGAATDGD